MERWQLIDELAELAESLADAQETAAYLADCEPSRELVSRAGLLVSRLQTCVDQFRALEGRPHGLDAVACQRAEQRAIEINGRRARLASTIERQRKWREQREREKLVAFFRERFSNA